MSQSEPLVSGPLRSRYAGIFALNPFMGCVSTSRLSMAIAQWAQKLTVDYPEPKLLQTSLEKDLKPHTFSIKAPENLKVLDIIRNRTGFMDQSLFDSDMSDEIDVEHIIIYEEVETGLIGGLEVPRTHSLDPRLGFTYYRVRDIKVGDFLNKGEVIADSIGALRETYEFTTNVNVAFCSDKATAEDAIVFNADTLWKFEYTTITKYQIKISDNETLINFWGKDGKTQVLPKIGQLLGPDGIIAVKRRFDEGNFISAGSPTQMDKVDHLNDRVYQGSTDGVSEVIAINVLKHPNKTVNGENRYEAQLNSLAQSSSAYPEAIVKSYIRERSRQRANGKEGLTTNEFNALLLRNVVQHGNEQYRIVPPKLTDKKVEISTYTITITIREKRLPDMGAKFTDMSASKGVISKIVPGDQMPRDQYGRVADICKSNDSIASRNIPGETHEQYLGNCSDLLHREFHQVLGTWTQAAQLENRPKPSPRRIHKQLRKIDNTDAGRELIVQCLRRVVAFYRTIYLGQYPIALEATLDEFMETGDPDLWFDLMEFMEEILIHRVLIPLTVDMVSELGAANIVTSLANSEFAPEIGPVTFNNQEGELRTTVDPIQIAPMAVMSLEKDGSESSASYSLQLQSMRMASTTTKIDKQLSPISKANIAMLALDNTVILSAVIGEEALAEMMDLCNNVDSRKARVNAILNSDTPLGETTLVDRNKTLYGPVVLQTLRHTLACYGAELYYVDES